MLLRAAKALASRTNRLPIWLNDAGGGTGLPRWSVKNRTTCPATRKLGTYAFNNIPSTNSTSSITCPSRTSLMFVSLATPNSLNASATPNRAAAQEGARGGPALPPLTSAA
ncbi:MAG: hypothetical protein QOJ66_2420 [Ilumatobacteraceae bacterium]